jgi:cell division protein FtsL
MERWDIVIVIASLVALFIAVATPLIKLNTTITKLNGSIDSLGEKVTDINCENKKQHDDLFGTARRQGETLADHETRIRIIEEFPIHSKNEK